MKHRDAKISFSKCIESFELRYSKSKTRFIAASSDHFNFFTAMKIHGKIRLPKCLHHSLYFTAPAEKLHTQNPGVWKTGRWIFALLLGERPSEVAIVVEDRWLVYISAILRGILFHAIAN